MYAVNGLVVTLIGIQNVRSRFIVVVQMRLRGLVYFQVKISLSVGRVWVITAQ